MPWYSECCLHPGLEASFALVEAMYISENIYTVNSMNAYPLFGDNL